MSDVIVNGKAFDGSVTITNGNCVKIKPGLDIIGDGNKRYEPIIGSEKLNIAAEVIHFADGKNLVEKLAEMAELKRKRGSDIRAKLKLTF